MHYTIPVMTENTHDFNLGSRIHELRTNRKLSQEQLALRSNITTTYLGLIERDLKNPTLKVVEQVCRAMDISLAELFSPSFQEPSELDACSLQILSQIRNCSEEEKKVILRLIKDVLHFKNLPGSSDSQP